MIKAVSPNVLGWLEKKLSRQEKIHLWECIESGGKDLKENLAGNISTSHVIPDIDDWFFNNTLIELIERYGQEFIDLTKSVPTTKFWPICLERMWVNYQNQYEFNPLHDHTGIYSFVVWMKIPTSFEEQKKLPFARSNSVDISNFEFIITNILGQPCPYTYFMSPEYEGTMLFFPSKLTHIVYPFYNCDDQRISISGNLSLKV